MPEVEQFTRFQLRPLGKPRPTRIYSVANGLNSACMYYRLVTPFKTAEDLGLADYKIDDQDTLDKNAIIDWALKSQAHVYYLLLDKLLIKRMRMLRKQAPIWDRRRKILYPTPVSIWDADDDLECVDPMNPKFCTLGTHHVDGTPLGKGDRIMLKPDPTVDKALPQWVDGRVYRGQKFDITDNWKRLHLYFAMIREADGITVTNEHLAKTMRAIGGRRVYVFPNSIRFQDYPEIDLRRNERQVKILWQGGWSHYRDWYPLADALGRVAERYRHARFIFWGMDYPSIMKTIPATQREHIGWMPHDAYILKLSTIGHDINLCPLADNKFNRAKSAIKWYEASALKPPVCTLAQANGPYTEIQDRKTGLLFTTPEEFEARLSELIESAALRQELAENAQTWVRENRAAEVTVPGLLNFYRQVSQEARDERAQA